ncbi:hypothetical protein NDU88_003309 [Pleurodeles waltl]|uniref:Uncharacterized protein n=1 Tax=Pleurodeles waltl TaxID=8319 RepID=A0AAV7MQ69_PLEWA|nr:hypothetical protein NDU88_003309 [Pleurodeles waltl]
MYLSAVLPRAAKNTPGHLGERRAWPIQEKGGRAPVGPSGWCVLPAHTSAASGGLACPSWATRGTAAVTFGPWSPGQRPPKTGGAVLTSGRPTSRTGRLGVACSIVYCTLLPHLGPGRGVLPGGVVKRSLSESELLAGTSRHQPIGDPDATESQDERVCLGHGPGRGVEAPAGVPHLKPLARPMCVTTTRGRPYLTAPVSGGRRVGLDCTEHSREGPCSLNIITNTADLWHLHP